VSNRVKINIV